MWLMNKTTRNQKYGLLLAIFSAFVYWYFLLLMNHENINIKSNHFLALLFGSIIAILTWLKFVLTMNE